MISIFLSSCVSEDSMWSIPPADLLHDNNSKVWMIQNELQEGKDYSPYKRSKKETILFFSDGDFYIQRIDEWGTDSLVKGTFSLLGLKGKEQTKLILDFKAGDKVNFVIEKFSKKEFVLQYETDTSRRLVLTTLTKPTN